VARELMLCGQLLHKQAKSLLPIYCWVASDLSNPQSLTHAAVARRPTCLCTFGPVVLHTPGLGDRITEATQSRRCFISHQLVPPYFPFLGFASEFSVYLQKVTVHKNPTFTKLREI